MEYIIAVMYIATCVSKLPMPNVETIEYRSVDSIYIKQMNSTR